MAADGDDRSLGIHPGGVRPRQVGPWLVLSVSGDMDVAMAPSFSEACGRRRFLAIDLHGVTFMDCSGIGALAGVRSRVAAAGGSVRLVAPSEEALRVLVLTDLERLFPTFATVDGATSSPAAS